MLNIPAGTIVTKQRRGLRTVSMYGRILGSFTRKDVTGRVIHYYRVDLMEANPSGSPRHRTWPASHVIPVAPPPTTEAFAEHA
jgi:hypothetical protein